MVYIYMVYIYMVYIDKNIVMYDVMIDLLERIDL